MTDIVYNDAVVAAQIRLAANQLNSLIEEARQQGITVELNVVSYHDANGKIYNIEVSSIGKVL